MSGRDGAGASSVPVPPALGAAEAERLLALDRGARAAAQTRFDQPLVLEAGAGTGKTTTLIARLLAWCLGEGWDKAVRSAPAGAGGRAEATETQAAATAATTGNQAAAASGAQPAATAGGQAAATAGAQAAATTGGQAAGTAGGQAAVTPGDQAEGTGGAQAAATASTAARVLRRVAALTFTEAAAAEMAERAARELLALGRGGSRPGWLAAARLPPAPELARRARALLAALDQLTVETIHAWCFRLLAAHPLEAAMHPRLQIDADGRLVRQIIAETVESALRPGYGAPGDPHLLALAARGCGPREVAAALAALVDAGMTAAQLRRDPFAGDGWPALRRRIAAAGAALRELLAPRLAGSRLKNATGVLEGLEGLDGSEGLEGLDGSKGLVGFDGSKRLDASKRLDGSTGLEGSGGIAGPETRDWLLAAAQPVAGAPMAPVAPGARAVPATAGAPLGPLAGASPGVAEAAATAADAVAAGCAAEIAALQRRCAAALPANLRQHLREWSRGRLGGRERQRLGEVAGELAERSAAVSRLLSHLDDLDPERLRHARLALAPLLAAVEGELRRRGIATFDALLSGARQLLATHAEVRARVRRGIDQLLVDEFQDTDDTQCEVLAWIAFGGPAGERPGLFLVGDPKQSIYGWRSADLRAYEGFVARVVAAGGEVLPLVENFRSLPAVLEEVARVVGPVMRERPGVQPPFAPLLAARHGTDGGAAAGGRAAVEHWVSWPAAAAGAVEPEAEPPARQAAAAAIEATAIAADLLELHHQEGLPWREAAILLRSTGDLDTYLEALRRAGIPFAVGRDKQYFRRREVIDAAALVRTVLDPGDHLALVTLLRSPAVGVPDAALLPLWRQQLPRLLTELHQPGGEPLAAVRQAVEAAAGDLPAAVPGLDRVAGWELSLLAAVEQLAVLREAFAAEPADRFVERLRRLPLLDTTAAARDLGAYRLANLDRFFRHLLLELEEGSGDVAAVLRALRDDVAEGREAEEGRPPEGAEDAVRVLTIHGAKGLDFAHVYLPQLHKPPGGERPATAVGRLPGAAAAVSPVGPIEPGDPAGAEPCEMRLLGAASPGFDLVEERRLEVAAAERVRTLYVAMTRAKDRLVLAGAWPRRPAEPPPPPHARTHLDLLAWRPGCPDLQQLWNAGGGAGDAGLSSDGDMGLTGGAVRNRGLVSGGDSGREAGVARNPDRQAGGHRSSCLDPYGVVWRFPALAGPSLATGTAGARGPDRGDGAALTAPAEVAAQAARLGLLRPAAAARMARPFGAAASEEAHARLREEMAAGERLPSAAVGAGNARGAGTSAAAAVAAGVDNARGVEAAVPAGSGAAGAAGRGAAGTARAAAVERARIAGREAAMAAGAAVHRALELWDLDADPARESARQEALLPAYLSAVAPADIAAGALPRCRQLLAQFRSGGLADRLRRLAAGVLARELPVLLAPTVAGPAGDAGPVAYVSGSIDLLYSDPESGGLVIADYKTDEVAGAEIQRRAASYASQGAAYVQAIQEALGLVSPPRFELWFLHAGEVVTAPAAGSAS